MADEESAVRARISPDAVRSQISSPLILESDYQLIIAEDECTTSQITSAEDERVTSDDSSMNPENVNCLEKKKFLLRSNKNQGVQSDSSEATDVKEAWRAPVCASQVMESSCQTDPTDCSTVDDGDRCKDYEKLSDEFEKYKRDVEAIIQASVKAKELELEERFAERWHQLVTMETSIHDKLTQSEHHASCLHAALKSAMIELGNLKDKIDEFSVKNSSAQNCIPVDLRFVQNVSAFGHLNGTLKDQNANGTPEATNCLGSKSFDPRGSQCTTSEKVNTSRVKSPEAVHSRCSSADDLSKAVDSFSTKTFGNLPARVPLFSGAPRFLLNFKYPAPTDSMLASYFPSALFCIPQSSAPVPSTSSPSLTPAVATLSPTQYVLPGINPFVKLSSGSLPTSPPEVKPKLVPNEGVRAVSKLLNVNKSSSPCTQTVASSPSSYPPADAFQTAKVEPTDGSSPDTSEIAQRVRDILSAHNIGQRQFAREVLGLSQGTVSELLSKPKPWDKLTEKGRESYRKMLAWTQEENNYLELKMSGYKNGQSALPQPLTIQPIPRADDSSSSTEMRISQILMQAQAAIHNQTSLGRTPKIELKSNGDALKIRSVQRQIHSRDSHATSGRSSVNDFDGLSRRTDCQSVSNDSLNFVTRIYREQLIELMKTAEKNKNQVEVERYKAELLRISAQASSASAVSNSSNVADSTGTLRDEVKKEPVDSEGSTRLACHSEGPEDLSFGRNKNLIVKLVKDEPKSPESLNGDLSRRSENSSIEAANLNSHSSSSLDQTSGKHADDSATVGSPLRQMQSITNSIVNSSAPCTPGSQAFPSQHSAGSRINLPPIDQDTWEKCSNLNTDDIVQRVKELLSEYCISQRLFGEHVLGLSQGSVSDLLARPKPWYMLTHKGREPFVRMKCFLDEPQSVQNLVANQYKVPTDKLLRVAGSNPSQCSLTAQSASEPPILAGRKRKPSNSLFDESTRSDADQSSVHYKKNRISFTDEQKKLLRQTYKSDPYPLHSTIEQLAATLEVGVKTVVNWFHNHRMRDKSRFVPSNSWDQQNDSLSPQTQQQEGVNLSRFQIKSEDQSSQSCDSSSDFFLYLNNNNGNSCSRQESATDMTFSSGNENHDDVNKQGHLLEGDEASEPDDSEDVGEQQKKEPKIISKRKSARPQRMMSCHYVADKNSGFPSGLQASFEGSENPSSFPSSSDANPPAEIGSASTDLSEKHAEDRSTPAEEEKSSS